MRKPPYLRYRAKYRYAQMQYRNTLRRQIERNQTFLLMGMAFLLLLASCTKHLTTTRDREHAAPIVAQKGGLRV